MRAIISEPRCVTLTDGVGIRARSGVNANTVSVASGVITVGIATGVSGPVRLAFAEGGKTTSSGVHDTLALWCTTIFITIELSAISSAPSIDGTAASGDLGGGVTNTGVGRTRWVTVVLGAVLSGPSGITTAVNSGGGYRASSVSVASIILEMIMSVCCWLFILLL